MISEEARALVPAVTDHALPEGDCQVLVGAFHRFAATNHPQVRKRPERTEIPAVALARDDPAAAVLLGRGRDLILAAVTGRLDPGTPALYHEHTLLTMMLPGDQHVPHADAEREQPDGTWGPNHTPQRDATGLLYLSSDFEGGVLGFPGRGWAVKPEAGTLATFGCGHGNVHQVTPVTSGARYSLSCWLSCDPAREEAWPVTA